MKQSLRWVNNVLPRSLVGIAIVLQFIIVGFLVVLSATTTTYLVRSPFDHPSLEFGNMQEYYVISRALPSLIFIGSLILLVLVFVVLAQLLTRVRKNMVLAALLSYVGVTGMLWIGSLDKTAPGYTDSSMLSCAAVAINTKSTTAFANVPYDPHTLPSNCWNILEWNLYEYFHYYPFQSGPALWFSWLFKYFGVNNIIAFQMFNVLAMVITVACLWYMVGKLSDSSASRCAFALVCVTCLPMIMYSSFMYTNELGFMMVMVSVICVVRSIAVRNPILAGTGTVVGFLIIGVGITVKSTYVIVLLALVIGALFAMWRNRRYWLAPVVLVAAYVANKISVLPVHYLERIAGYSFGKGMPMSLWVMMGLQEFQFSELPFRRQGWWNPNPAEVFDQAHGNYEQQSEIAAETIKSQLDHYMQHPGEGYRFFMDKLASEWSEPTFETRLFSEKGVSAIQFDGKINHLLIAGNTSVFMRFMNTWQTSIYVLAAVGIAVLFVQLLRRGWDAWSDQRVVTTVTLCAAFIGGFLCYVFWEAKSLYVFPFFMLLFPMAALGVRWLGSWLIMGCKWAYKCIAQKAPGKHSSSVAVRA